MSKKPTSQIIQISATSSHVVYLCADGSSWSYEPLKKEWQCILSRAEQLQRQAIEGSV